MGNNPQKYLYRIFRLFILCLILVILYIPTILYALKPEKEYWTYPFYYGIIYEDVHFITKDGLKLKGWFFPAQDTTGISRHVGARLPDSLRVSVPEGKKPIEFPHKKPTIIITNGDAGNMSYLIWHAHKFFPYGYNVLLFDWRGFGESAEWEIDEDRLSYTEFLWDLHATIDYVKTRDDVDPNKIALFGFSTGAYLIFGVAKDRNDITAIGVRPLLSSFNETLPLLERLSPERNLYFPPDYPEEAEPVNAAEYIKCPIFMAVGEKDDRTPPWMSQKVFDVLEGDKLLWVAKDAAHGGGQAPEYTYPRKFFALIRAFFETHLKQ